MKRPLNIILIIAALTMGSCDIWKRPPIDMELPPVTEEGKNTFSCMIEGEVYVPQMRRIAFPLGYCIEVNFPEFPDYCFIIRTYRFVDKQNDTVMDAHVEFGSDSICTTGIYTLDGSVSYNYITYRVLPGTASLTITRLDNRIISGQFHFQAIDTDDTNSKIITISNGRFDLCKGYYK